MSRRFASFIIAMLFTCCASSAALAATPAEEAYEQGTACLVKAEFAEAMAHYAAAAKAAPDNEQYKQQYMLVRRVITIRKNLQKTTDPERWNSIARALRNFYLTNKVYGEALKLDQQRWDKTPNEEAAVLLAETQLEMNKNAEAATVLAQIAEPKTARTASLRALAQARLKNAEQAKKLADGCPATQDKPDPNVQFDLACAYCLLGDNAAAAKHLVACFEHTKPSLHETLKDYARQRADLAPLVKDKDHASVWDTKSKITESSCSGGTSCGSCPSRGSCSSAGGTDAKNEHKDKK